jgi:hypothetical protein
MALVTLSADDVKKVKIVDPGKYALLIEKWEVKPSSKGDGSPVHHISQRIQGGEFDGVPIMSFLSKKMNSQLKLLMQLSAVAGQIVGDAGGQFDTSQLEGKVIGAYVVTGQDQSGDDQNVINRYFPASDL